MRKATITIIFLFLGFIVFIFLYTGKPKQLTKNSDVQFENKLNQHQAILPTESFILKHLRTKKGHIQTTFTDRYFLSESIGLWLKYLSLKDDRVEFANTLQVIEEDYVLKENIITWEIQNDEKAHTNALIDDLRIIEALLFDNPSQDQGQNFSLAKNITDALLTYNYSNGYFVDFYDVFYKEAYDQITLSYLNTKAFQLMVENKLMSGDLYNQLLIFLESIPKNETFFPKTFNISEEQFVYDEEVHLVDQLYVAIYLEQANISTDNFFNWLNKLYTTDQRIYGRYDRQNKAQTVDYESAAVYALAIIYSLERGNEVFAKDLYERMIELRVNDQEHSFYGGYVNLETEETHSFDNLLPLIAERILQLEKVIDE